MKTQKPNYPTLQYNDVIHIGSLNKADKKMNSLEGAGLSVSVNPEEWRAIAKLGGNSWHRLTKKDATFLDYHQLTVQQQQEIIQWGIQEDYVEECTVYFHTWIDGETDEERSFESTDYKEILNEVEADDEEDEEEQVQEKLGHAATDKLKEATCRTDIPPFLVVDLLATLFAEQVLGMDGVWWQDDLDEGALSAPRGVINARFLAEWQTTKIQ